MRACFLLWVFFGAAVPWAIATAGCEVDAEEARRVLAALRSQPRACGSVHRPAAAPLRWQPVLDLSARRHADALAALDRLSHVGAGGTSLRARLREVGYVMRVSAENLAGGPETLDEALAQWLASPAHCENLMAADLQEFGLACAAHPDSQRRYWVLQLAAPAGGQAPAPAGDRP